MSRELKLKQMYHCLNTPEGKVLMDELRTTLDGGDLFDSDPLVMAQNVAGRDVFKYLEVIQRGDAIK